MSSRNLLIVRAGDRSLHPGWLRGRRDWDLHVSYFGNRQNPFGGLPEGISLSYEKGPKFIGILECLGKQPSLLDAYDYVGFPDDDLRASCDTWNLTFSILRGVKADLGQPSLDHRSFFFHDVVLQRKWLHYRKVDFVEVMTPIFHKSFLQAVLPTLGYTKSSWGLDFLWRKMGAELDKTFVIVDACSVLHTRSIGSGTQYSKENCPDLSPAAEYEQFLKQYQVDNRPGRALLGVRCDGSQVADEDRLNRREMLPRLHRKWKRIMGIELIK
jgi:hypothetical protein